MAGSVDKTASIFIHGSSDDLKHSVSKLSISGEILTDSSTDTRTDR